jgi:hypothetical protein
MSFTQTIRRKLGPLVPSPLNNRSQKQPHTSGKSQYTGEMIGRRDLMKKRIKFFKKRK